MSEAEEANVVSTAEPEVVSAPACVTTSGAAKQTDDSGPCMPLCDCCAADSESETECFNEEPQACLASPDLSTLYEEARLG